LVAHARVARVALLDAPSNVCVPLRVPDRPSPVTRRVGETRPPYEYQARTFILLLRSDQVRMPSRQERRRAERDAAKRTSAQAGGAARAARAAAAVANLNMNVNPGGDWTTQAEDPDVLGAEIAQQRAYAGDREGQFSLGYSLMCEAAGQAAGTPLGVAGRSPKADVGLDSCNRDTGFPSERILRFI